MPCVTGVAQAGSGFGGRLPGAALEDGLASLQSTFNLGLRGLIPARPGQASHVQHEAEFPVTQRDHLRAEAGVSVFALQIKVRPGGPSLGLGEIRDGLGSIGGIHRCRDKNRQEEAGFHGLVCSRNLQVANHAQAEACDYGCFAGTLWMVL